MNITTKYEDGTYETHICGIDVQVDGDVFWLTADNGIVEAEIEIDHYPTRAEIQNFCDNEVLSQLCDECGGMMCSA